MVKFIVGSVAACALASAVSVLLVAPVRAEGKRAVRAACFGDSITEGYKITDAFTTPYPDMLQKLLDEKKGKGAYEVINAGISGQDTRQGLARLDDVLKKKPDWMLLLYGTNDLWTSRKMALSDTDKNLRAIVAKIKAAGVKCMIGTIVPTWDFDAKVSAINDVIKKIAKDESITAVDMNESFEKALGEAGDRAKSATWERYYQVEDGGFVHPNDKGNKIIADNWYGALDREERRK